MPSLLYPSQYVETGTYIKASETYTTNSKPEFMLPVVIGKGSKYLRQYEKIKRGYVYQELVTVSELYPNTFNTKYPLVKDKKQIQIWIDSQKISNSEWEIVDEYTIQMKEYIPDVSYYIDYQSSSDEVEDKINIDVVLFESVGFANGASNFTEFENFYLDYFLNNLRINKEKDEDVLSFYDSYSSDLDYPSMIDYVGINSLEVKVGDIGNNILDITGKVTRVEYRNDTNIDYIWLELYFDDYIVGNLKVVNDSKYYSFLGIDFKIIGTDFHSTLVTKNSEFLRDDGYCDEISFKAIPTKTLIKGPARTVTLSVNQKGTLEINKDITNVETDLGRACVIEILEDSKNISTKYTLIVDSLLFNNDEYFVVFDLYNQKYSKFFIVPIVIEDGKVYLKDDISLISDEGVEIKLYKRPTMVLNTETNVGIQDEQGRFLIVHNSRKISYDIGTTILKFDYECSEDGTPTIIYVTDTYSNKNEKIEITNYENYYCFDSIYAKLNYDKIESGDVIQFDIDKNPYISWNLTKDYEESFDSILIDYSGSINGGLATKYVKLNKVPIDGIELITDEKFDYELIIKDNEAYVLPTYNGIPYEPRYPFSVRYRAKTNQPKIGNYYYVVAICIRPDSMYNTLIEVNSLTEGRDLIGPFERFNDLYVANEIAWKELTIDNKYGYVQIKDSDDDGVITKSDVEAAVNCLSKFKKATDIVLVNQFDSIHSLIKFSFEQNDAFQSDENKIWIGFPSNYSIEQMIEFSNSIYDNPFGDFRVLVGNNEARIMIDTVPINAKVDGSFIAWAMACIRRSEKTKYAESLVKQRIESLSDIKTFEISEIRNLGDNNISYIVKDDSSDYFIAEDLTNSGNIEQVTDQQIYVCRYMRNNLDSLIGITSDSPSSNIQTIQSRIISNLKEMVKTGVISVYLNEDGTKRDLDPSLDITVKQVKDNETQYLFGFGFYTKKGIKHLFGSYVIDSSFNE